MIFIGNDRICSNTRIPASRRWEERVRRSPCTSPREAIASARWARLLALGLGLSLGGGTAAADIHHCDGGNGIVVYTDRSCKSLGIRKLAARSRPGHARVEAAPPLSLGCPARSPQSMRAAVDDAIVRRDFNALSGLFDFNGSSRRSAAPVVARLERIARRTLLEIDLVVATGDYAFDFPAYDPNALPTLHIVQYGRGGEGELSIEDFSMRRSAGCLWLAM